MEAIEVQNDEYRKLPEEARRVGSADFLNIQKDMELVSSIMEEIKSLINHQEQDLSHIGDNIIRSQQEVQKSEKDLDRAVELQSSNNMINTYIYTTGGTLITGGIGVTLGLKPAIIAGIVTGSIFIFGKAVAYWKS